MSLDSAGSFMETPAVAKVAMRLKLQPYGSKRESVLHYEIVEQIAAGGLAKFTSPR
jgi:hypothetical protein